MAPILEAGADPRDQRAGACPTGWPVCPGRRWRFGVPTGGKHIRLPAAVPAGPRQGCGVLTSLQQLPASRLAAGWRFARSQPWQRPALSCSGGTEQPQAPLQLVRAFCYFVPLQHSGACHELSSRSLGLLIFLLLDVNIK